MNALRSTMQIAGSVLAGLALSVAAASAALQSVSVSRGLTTFALVDPTEGVGDFDSDQVQNEEPGDFDQLIQSDAQVDDATAHADAFQTSMTHEGGFFAAGGFSAHSDIGSSGEFCEGLGMSQVRYRFSITAPTPIRSFGSIRAAGNGVMNYSLIGNSEIIFYFSFQDDLVSIDEEHLLQPGNYEVNLSTSGYGQSFPGGGEDAGGNFEIYFFEEGTTGVEPSDVSRLNPVVAPNPIADRAIISLQGSGATTHTISILDAKGRLVRGLGAVPGSSSVEWNARDDAGHRVPGGVYFVRIESQQGPGESLRTVVLRH